MQFLADMGVSRTVIRTLRERGHNAVHLSEEMLQRLPDEGIIAKARKENRVILTHDLDFSRLLATGEITKPSVITFRLSSMQPKNVLAHLLPALSHFEVELEKGALVTVDDAASRCRSLPIRQTD